MDDDSRLRAAQAIVDAAEVRAAAGDFPGALKCYVEALRRMISGSSASFAFDAADAFLIERCADYAVVCGQGAAAGKLLAALFAVLVKANNNYAAGLVSLKLLRLALEAGDRRAMRAALTKLQGIAGPIDIANLNPEALEVLNSSPVLAGMADGDRRLFLCTLCLEVSRMMLWLGRYGAARDAAARALDYAHGQHELFRSLADAIRLTAAAVELDCGNVGAADAQLAPLAPNQDQVNPVLHVTRCELMAQSATLRGEFSKAEDWLRLAMQHCVRHSLQNAQAAATANLAHLLLILNRTFDAERLLDDVAGLVSGGVSEGTAQRLSSIRTLVHARRWSGFAGVSLAPANESVWNGDGDGSANKPFSVPLAADGSGSLMERFATYTLQVYAMFAAGRFADVRSLMMRMDEIFRRTDSTLMHLRLDLIQGLFSYYSGSIIDAAAAFSQAAAGFTALGLRHDLWQARSFQLWCMAGTGAGGPQISELRREIEYLLDSFNASLSNEHRVLFNLNKWSEDETRFAERIAGLVACKAGKAASWISRMRRWWLSRILLDQLIVDIDCRRSEVFVAVPKVRKWTSYWWCRVLKHRPGQLTLSFLVLPDRTLVVREGFLRLDFFVIPITRLLLRDLLRKWHESMADEQGDRRDRLSYIDDILRKLHFSHLLKGIHNITTLRIVSDDALHGFPFAALHENGRLLVSNMAICFGLTHIRWGRKRRFAARSAVVAYNGLGSEDVSPLPGAAIEADAVSRHLATKGYEVNILRDDKATPQAIAAALSSVSLVHIACHGIFRRDDMARTGLILAPGLESGLLSLRGLADLRLENLAHVTLSSCWSADNFLLPGRKVISLPQVLRYAGAASVVSCLWKVNDGAAGAFFSRFYQHMMAMPAACALRQAQLDFQCGGVVVDGLALTDPYFWAGFVLHTD